MSFLNIRNLTRPLMLSVALGAVTMLSGCWSVEIDRSAEENQQFSGRQDRGRDPGNHRSQERVDPETGEAHWDYALDYRDVIIAPDGSGVFVQVPLPGPDQGWEAPGMMLTFTTLENQPITVTFPHLRDIRRINFSPDGASAYVLGAEGRTVTRIAMDTFQSSEWVTFDTAYKVLDVSPDGRFIVASNIETDDAIEWFGYNGACASNDSADYCSVGLWDTVALKASNVAIEQRLRDLDFAPDGAIILTSSAWDEDGVPVAELAFVDAASATIEDVVAVPNCADELKLQPGGDLALLAPIRCRERGGASADPISIIDLATRTFVTNLPGFGPVDISDDGSRAIGFTRRNDMASQWNFEQKEAVGLIVVELPSLQWQVIEYGSAEPAYLATGESGRWVYTHHSALDCVRQRDGSSPCDLYESPLYMIDVETGSRIAVSTTDARLDQFVRVGDAYALLTDGVLTYLTPGSTEVTEIELPFKPELLNIRPQGDLLVFGERDAPIFYTAPIGAEHEMTPFAISSTNKTPLSQ